MDVCLAHPIALANDGRNPPGGPIDIIGCMLAENMRPPLGQPLWMTTAPARRA